MTHNYLKDGASLNYLWKHIYCDRCLKLWDQNNSDKTYYKSNRAFIYTCIWMQLGVHLFVH